MQKLVYYAYENLKEVAETIPDEDKREDVLDQLYALIVLIGANAEPESDEDISVEERLDLIAHYSERMTEEVSYLKQSLEEDDD